MKLINSQYGGTRTSRSVKRSFGIDNFTHPVTNPEIFVEGKDVFLSIQTGGGKSMTYHAYPFLAKPNKPC